MPGLSNGTSNAADYNIGRGVVYLSPLDATTGLPTNQWRDVGNAPSFSAGVTTEKYQHKSSRAGLKTIDLEAVIGQEAEISIELDEWNDENLALFFSGTTNAYTNGSVAGFTEYVMVPDGKLLALRHYQVVSSTGVRCFDIDSSKLTVKTNEGSPVTLVLGTDFTVNSSMGLIYILNTAKVTTAIAATKGLKVTLTADASASPIRQVKALKVTNEKVAIMFCQENANGETEAEVIVHKISLSADGELGFISDEAGVMKFKGKAEKNVNGDTITRSVATVPRY